MTITIPKETLKAWKELRSPEDMKELRSITKLEKSTLYYILNTGKCSSKKVAGQLIKFHAKLEDDLKAFQKLLGQEA